MVDSQWKITWRGVFISWLFGWYICSGFRPLQVSIHVINKCVVVISLYVLLSCYVQYVHGLNNDDVCCSARVSKAMCLIYLYSYLQLYISIFMSFSADIKVLAVKMFRNTFESLSNLNFLFLSRIRKTLILILIAYMGHRINNNYASKII